MQPRGEAGTDDDAVRVGGGSAMLRQVRGEYLAQQCAAPRVTVVEIRRGNATAGLPARPPQSPGGKLARSGTPDRKSAISRGGAAGPGAGPTGTGRAPNATRVAEPTWLAR